MIIHSDCLTALKELESDSIDSMVTDPPYGINFMGKSWDDFSKDQQKHKEVLEVGGHSNDLAKGMAVNHPIYKFEGMIEFFTPIWKEAYRVMKPGAFGFVCCIPRQDCLSRMILSLEQSGFQINFSPLYWTYAVGFPKALNISKKITKDIEKLMKEQGIEEIEWED